jgi:hypothetical protein
MTSKRRVPAMPAFRLFGFLGSYERSQAREARMGATVSRNLEPESRHGQGKKGYETSVQV